MADSASPRDGFTGLRPDAGQVNAPTTRPERPCRSSRHMLEAWRGGSIGRGRAVCRWTVLRDIQATNRQRRGRHAFVQPAAASRGV